MDTMNQQQPTAIIYARVSSAGQAEEELAIQSQVEQCERKAAALGARVLRVFKDEGLSGRSVAWRPAFQRARDFCLARGVSYFITWAPSRFARSKTDSAFEKQQLRRAGTKVVYAANDIRAETDEGWLSESIMEVVDELYSRNIAKDTLRSMVKNAEDGFFNGGRVPFGYRVVDAGKRRRLEVEEDEAPIVRRIFAAYAGGAGCKVIAMDMNRAQLLKRGQRWNKTSVALLLKNHRYIGVSVFGRRGHQDRSTRPESEWITTASHAPIIDRDTFERVQAIMGSRAPGSGQGSPHSQHVFTGMVRCHCGVNMKIETATGRTKRYSYYNCGAAIDGRGCPGQRINADVFDRWAMGELLDRLFTEERLQAVVESVHQAAGRWIHDRKEQRDLLVRELRATERRRDKLFELLELDGKDTPGLADITSRLRGHKDRIVEIEAMLEDLERAPAIPPGTVDLAQVREELRSVIEESISPERQRLFFAAFIASIEVREEAVTFTYHPDRMVNHLASESAVHSKEIWLPERGFMRTAALLAEFPESLRLRRAA